MESSKRRTTSQGPGTLRHRGRGRATVPPLAAYRVALWSPPRNIRPPTVTKSPYVNLAPAYIGIAVHATLPTATWAPFGPPGRLAGAGGLVPVSREACLRGRIA